ncbi:MAG: response regulator [Candidatus Latescibacterota bacterium]|nr:response regulator [Candidatus Latescibacterota bacterium]OPX22953.1 MAG: response regulator [Candidatus Latescibacteria bacterium 4484_107]RKY69790.1 MAG: response regulator [Candidatus Latescibacterota bacterium]
MKILIAEDDMTSRRMLETRLVKWGYEVVATSDGNQAREALQGEDAPQLAILDWMMPGLDGVEVCRRVRELEGESHIYIILLTAKDRKEDLVAGLDAGADDYLTKPFKREEMRARLQVGIRTVDLQNRLAEHIKSLEDALSQIKQLQGMLPICAYCKKIRTDDNYWQQVEGYIMEHSEAEFSHSICPECYEKYVKPELEELGQHRKAA